MSNASQSAIDSSKALRRQSHMRLTSCIIDKCRQAEFTHILEDKRRTSTDAHYADPKSPHSSSPSSSAFAPLLSMLPSSLRAESLMG
jgi:hypothetical protein